jgi:hypothetical protein
MKATLHYLQQDAIYKVQTTVNLSFHGRTRNLNGIFSITDNYTEPINEFCNSSNILLAPFSLPDSYKYFEESC